MKADYVSGLLFASLDANFDATLDESEYRNLFAFARGGGLASAVHNPVAGPVGKNPLRSLNPDEDAKWTQFQR